MLLNATSVGVGRRNRFFLYLCSINCIIVIINIFVYIVVVMYQNRQMVVTSLGCCWYSRGPSQSPDCWSSSNVQRKIGVGGIESHSGIIIEDVCEDGM